VTDEPSTGTMIHGDLHYTNVLAADREPWLVIDPDPMSGDPHYEPAPMLWNRVDELAGDVRGGLRRRFHTLVDSAGLDEDRARDWVVVRMVLNAHWAVEDAERAHRGLTDLERDWITTCVAVAKAVQD
jgi:streptomycin 6-kinase